MHFFKNILRNWRSTVTGVAGVSVGVLAIVHDPTLLLDAKTLGLIALGVGQILGKDGAVTGVAPGTPK